MYCLLPLRSTPGDAYLTKESFISFRFRHEGEDELIGGQSVMKRQAPPQLLFVIHDKQHHLTGRILEK